MFQRPQVVLLGCFHQAQLPPISNTLWDDHRRAFAEVLAELLTTFRIQFIGEEAEQGAPSGAAKMAASRHIGYHNLDIPLTVQQGIRVHPPYGFDEETGEITKFEGNNQYVDAWNIVREYHMYQTFLDVYDGCSPSLLICGTAHQGGLRKLLGRQFEIVSKTFDIENGIGRLIELGK